MPAADLPGLKARSNPATTAIFRARAVDDGPVSHDGDYPPEMLLGPAPKIGSTFIPGSQPSAPNSPDGALVVGRENVGIADRASTSWLLMGVTVSLPRSGLT